MARRIAEWTSGKPMICFRHLLGAVLVSAPDGKTPGAWSHLAKLGLDVKQVREELLRFLLQDVPLRDDPDDLDAWAAILRGGRLEPGQAYLVGFDADVWSGRDLLGIGAEVEALADLAAAWSVVPPLSIGLFGEWGSGKTFFMKQMMDRVERLSEAARLSGKPQREIGYCKNIVQIEFNAWQYMEGNLWASLVEHIFANLRLSRNQDGRIVAALREAKQEEIAAQKEVEEEARRRVQELETQAAEAERRSREADAEFRSRAGQIGRLLRNALSEKDLVSLGQEARQLGLSEEDRSSIETLQRAAVTTKDLASLMRREWDRLRSSPARFRALLVVVGLIAVFWLAGFWPHWAEAQGVVARVWTTVSWVFATAATAATPFLAWVGWLRVRFWWLVRKIDRAARLSRDERAQLRTLQGEAESSRNRRQQAEQEAEGARREIERLEKQLDETTPEIILRQFIEARAGSSDYTKLLGVLALVRRDFERLSNLFQEQREDEEAGRERAGLNPINRIILYIDDLDRCPPRRVVEVLQAIHLLLAFPLFVVVVGVDARWVRRSLEKEYQWLVEVGDDDLEIPAPAEGIVGNGQAAAGEPRKTVQGASAHDYLEKIFQIPFWLRPMERRSSVRFIEALTASAVAVESPGVKPAHDGPAGPTIGPQTPTEPIAGRNERTIDDPAAVDPGPAVADPAPPAPAATTEGAPAASPVELNPERLMLTEVEVDSMKELAGLVGRSPRAVKRFINCYRLIKAIHRGGALAQFLDDGQSGAFRPTLLTLAVIAGAPEIAQPYLEALAVPADGQTVADLIRRFDADAAIRSRPGWRRVRDRLDAFHAMSLADLARAATLVARFSFRTQGPTPPSFDEVGRRKAPAAVRSRSRAKKRRSRREASDSPGSA